MDYLLNSVFGVILNCTTAWQPMKLKLESAYWSIVSKLGMDVEGINELILGRALLLRLHLNDIHIEVIGVYAPATPDQRVNFYELLGNHLSNLLHNLEFQILMGDFNCVENPLLDRSKRWDSREPGAKEMRAIVSTYGMTDIYRDAHAKKRFYTFFSKVHKTESRLDRFYVSKNVQTQSAKFGKISTPISDHQVVIVVLKFSAETTAKGPSY